MKLQIFLFTVTILLFACTKQIEDREDSVFDFQPLKIGSTYLYHLDSFVTKPNSSAFEKHSYHLKDTIVLEFADNADKHNYRIDRYIRDTLDLTNWKFLNSYSWTVNDKNLEMTENNLRFIKLASPVSSNTVWKGNIYIDTETPGTPFKFLYGWEYQYQNINGNFRVRNGNIPNTVTVLQADETGPAPIFSPAEDYHEKNYSVEVYAKNIGLIYKEYFHWVWQKAPIPSFQPNSYGITLNLIDHKP